MKRLPYIDEHATTIAADPTTTWRALLAVACRDPEDPSTVPLGFALEEAVDSQRLALKGRHWFSTYRLVFVLTPDGADRTRVAAETWAAFPGVRGRVYRALVIGTGGHRIVVRQMLKRIAAKANSQSAETH